MKKIRGSLIAKILAWILVTISAAGMLASVVAAILIQENNFYSYTPEEIREELFAKYSDRYSAMALGAYDKEYFEDTNFRYGIIEADSLSELKKMNLNADSTYIERNFNEEVKLEDMHIFQCTITEDTWFSGDSPESLGGYYWISHAGEATACYTIEEYFYDIDLGIFFYMVGGKYYPVQNVCISLKGKNIEDGSTIEREWNYVYNQETRTYHSVDILDEQLLEEEATDTMMQHTDSMAAVDRAATATEDFAEDGSNAGLWISYGNFGYDIAEQQNLIYNVFPILEQKELTFDMLAETSLNMVARQETQLTWKVTAHDGSNARNVYTEKRDIVVSEGVIPGGWGEIETTAAYRILPEDEMLELIFKEKGTSYYVLSYVPEQLERNGRNLADEDLFIKADRAIFYGYEWRYDIYWVMAGCALVMVLSVIFLLCAAGHRSGSDEITATWMEKIPLEVSAGCIFILEMLIIWLVSNIWGNIDSLWRASGMLMYAVGLFLLFCAGWALLACILSFAVRIKLGKWWRNTIIYKICNSVFGGLGNLLRTVRDNISMLQTVLLVLAGVSILELIVIIGTQWTLGGELILWLFGKVVMALALIYGVIQLNKLKEAGEHIAQGDLQHKVDTAGMYKPFREHGENLNSLNEGLAIAVAERMKSEHFKTELITNVSHDIKTPLTSIINYVDLLKKEDIENETVQEYIEVLDRQSGRLKKLIEDLMEASKASTGNLAVNFEKLEAGVFMVQTVGEFEEKTKACGLELVIRKPEEPVYIMADGRHFWRVIDNLMNNICKYAQPQTRVYITLEKEGQKAHVIFRNTSKYPLNITSEELMERFVRGDSSRNTEGSGLGLSIARSLMELMHGSFDLVVDGDLFKVILTFDICE